MSLPAAGRGSRSSGTGAEIVDVDGNGGSKEVVVGVV